MIEDPFQASWLENIIIAKNPHVLARGQVEALQKIPVWTYVRLVADIADWQALILKPAHDSRSLVRCCVVRDEELDSVLSHKLRRKSGQQSHEVNRAIPGGNCERKEWPTSGCVSIGCHDLS